MADTAGIVLLLVVSSGLRGVKLEKHTHSLEHLDVVTYKSFGDQSFIANPCQQIATFFGIMIIIIMIVRPTEVGEYG